MWSLVSSRAKARFCRRSLSLRPEEIQKYVPRARSSGAPRGSMVIGALVPRPALDDAELVRAVEGDVDRAVPALGEARDCARRRLGNRPEAVVDRPHDVPPDEGRPAVARRDAVRPLLVGELSGGAVGHDEDSGWASCRATRSSS